MLLLRTDASFSSSEKPFVCVCVCVKPNQSLSFASSRLLFSRLRHTAATTATTYTYVTFIDSMVKIKARLSTLVSENRELVRLYYSWIYSFVYFFREQKDDGIKKEKESQFDAFPFNYFSSLLFPALLDLLPLILLRRKKRSMLVCMYDVWLVFIFRINE